MEVAATELEPQKIPPVISVVSPRNAINAGGPAAYRLVEEGGLFGGVVPERLRERKAMDTIQMEAIHSDTTDDLCHVASVLHSEFGISPESLSRQDREQVRHAYLEDVLIDLRQLMRGSGADPGE